MQDADRLDQTVVGDAVKEEVRGRGQLAVSGADFVDGAALPGAVRQCLARAADAENVAISLSLALTPRAVIPDFAEIGLRGRR